MRTDQLDGETDWKLKVAVPSCQALPTNEVYSKNNTHKRNHCIYVIIMQKLFNIGGSVFAEKPHKDIYNFVGNFTMVKLNFAH